MALLCDKCEGEKQVMFDRSKQCLLTAALTSVVLTTLVKVDVVGKNFLLTGSYCWVGF